MLSAIALLLVVPFVLRREILNKEYSIKKSKRSQDHFENLPRLSRFIRLQKDSNGWAGSDGHDFSFLAALILPSSADKANKMIRALQAAEKPVGAVGRGFNPGMNANRISAGFRAKPESLCPGRFLSGAPLPDGRVDFDALLSGYTIFGFAVAPEARAFWPKLELFPHPV
jgi:hypothetical protein